MKSGERGILKSSQEKDAQGTFVVQKAVWTSAILPYVVPPSHNRVASSQNEMDRASEDITYSSVSATTATTAVNAVTTADVPTSSWSCLDVLPGCSEWQAAGYCATARWYMTAYCPLSCGWCPEQFSEQNDPAGTRSTELTEYIRTAMQSNVSSRLAPAADAPDSPAELPQEVDAAIATAKAEENIRFMYRSGAEPGQGLGLRGSIRGNDDIMTDPSEARKEDTIMHDDATWSPATIRGITLAAGVVLAIGAALLIDKGFRLGLRVFRCNKYEEHNRKPGGTTRSDYELLEGDDKQCSITIPTGLATDLFHTAKFDFNDSVKSTTLTSV